MSYSPISTHRFAAGVPLAGVAGGQAPGVAVAVLLWALVSIAPVPRIGRVSAMAMSMNVTRIGLVSNRWRRNVSSMVPPYCGADLIGARTARGPDDVRRGCHHLE